MLVFSGKRLRQWRKKKGLSVGQLAALLKVSRQSIYEVEGEIDGRKPSVALLEKLSKVFPKVRLETTFFEQTPPKLRKGE